MVPAILGATACAPPSLRHAHSLDAGDVAFEVHGAVDNTVGQAELYGPNGDATVEGSPESDVPLTGDIRFRVGLGKGFEASASLIRVGLQYSILDERRHAWTPVSLALAAEAGVRTGGVGLLASAHIGDGPVALRPVANAWIYSSTMDMAFGLPPSMTRSGDYIENPGVTSNEDEGNLVTGLYARLHTDELLFPVGLEVPIRTGDDWELAPFLAYSHGILLGESYDTVVCSDCYAGLGDINLVRRSTLWAGIKVQPALRRPGSVPAPPKLPPPPPPGGD